MPNNTYVDISSINSALARLDQLWAEAGRPKYIIQSPNAAIHSSTPLHINHAYGDFFVEAVAIPSQQSNRSNFRIGKNKRSISYKYDFKHDFASQPVVSAVYDGPITDVNVTVDLQGNYKGANDTILITLTLGPASGRDKWNLSGGKTDQFFVHLIAIGT